MGKGTNTRKRKARAAASADSSGTPTPIATADAAAGLSIAETQAALASHEGRALLRAMIAAELLAGCSENRTKALAATLRVVTQSAAEENAKEELEHLRALAEQIEHDRRERAQMGAGVLYTNETPQLPGEGSGGAN